MTKTAHKPGRTTRRPAEGRETPCTKTAADSRAVVSEHTMTDIGSESLAAATSAKLSEALLYRRAVHAAGRAVLGLDYELGTIARINIEAPDGARIAWTTDELHEQTEERVSAILAATLAGRAAEEEILGSAQASSGGCGGSDLCRARDVAFDMEATMGFGKKWPLLYRGTLDRTHLLSSDPELAGRVNARLEVTYAFTRKLVARQRAAILFLAAALFNHRTIEGPALEQLLEEVRRRLAP